MSTELHQPRPHADRTSPPPPYSPHGAPPPFTRSPCHAPGHAVRPVHAYAPAPAPTLPQLRGVHVQVRPRTRLLARLGLVRPNGRKAGAATRGAETECRQAGDGGGYGRAGVRKWAEDVAGSSESGGWADVGGMEMEALSLAPGSQRRHGREPVHDEDEITLVGIDLPSPKLQRPPLSPLAANVPPPGASLARHLAHTDDTGYPLPRPHPRPHRPLPLPTRHRPKAKIDPHIFEDMHEHTAPHAYPSPAVVRAAREAEREAARQISWERRWEGRKERDYAREWAWWSASNGGEEGEERTWRRGWGGGTLRVDAGKSAVGRERDGVQELKT